MSLIIWLKYYFRTSELRVYFTLNVDQIIWQKPGYSRFCFELGFSFQFFVPVISIIHWPLSWRFQNRHNNISIINLTSEVIKNLLVTLALAMIIVYCLKTNYLLLRHLDSAHVIHNIYTKYYAKYGAFLMM